MEILLLVLMLPGQYIHIIYRCTVCSCDQAALWTVVSVCHTVFSMLLSSYHYKIFGCCYHGQKWCSSKRSRSGFKGQGHREQSKSRPNLGFSGPQLLFEFTDAYEMMHIAWSSIERFLLFSLPYGKLQGHGGKIVDFDPNCAFPDSNSSLNSPMATEWCTKLEVP